MTRVRTTFVPRVLAALSASLWALASAATAQPATVTADPKQAQIDALEAKANEILKEIAALKASAATTPPPPAPAPEDIQGWRARKKSVAAPQPQATASVNRAVDDGSVKVAAAPLDRAQQSNTPGASFQISADTQNSTATISVNGGWSGTVDGKNPGWATDSGWNLSFSAPLSKSDTTSIATLDSLASGAALKFGVSKFFVKIGQGALAPGYGDIVKAARTNCISMNGSANTPPDDCNASFITDKFIQDYTDEKQYENYIGLFYPDVPAFSLGLQAGAGYKTFDFLDPASGKKGSTDRGSFNLKAFGTLVPWQGVATLTGAITYQHAYKDAMSSTLCPTGSNAAFVQCATGAIGRPKSDDSYQASLEFRKQFALAKGPVHNLGFSLQVTRDFNQKVTGIDLPVYLVSDEKGNLIGGMRFGYTSDKHDLIVGVFAGSNFSVF